GVLSGFDPLFRALGYYTTGAFYLSTGFFAFFGVFVHGAVGVIFSLHDGCHASFSFAVREPSPVFGTLKPHSCKIVLPYIHLTTFYAFFG
ncbi:MAG: hypothetical protein LUF86_01915, partial [Clostridiales bacterium]|nr:hypothetical protein [Clostridiales bacterium]